jgi:hypothetical protein
MNPLHYSPSYAPSLKKFQQVSFFHLHTCVHNICTIFNLLHLFPTSSPISLIPIPPDRSCSVLLSFCIRRRKKCLFKVATKGVSLWHSHVYMNNSRISFISSTERSFLLLMSFSVSFFSDLQCRGLSSPQLS